MAKKSDLKNSMSSNITGGLDALINPTSENITESKSKSNKYRTSFILDEDLRKKMKIIAIKKDITLTEIVQEAIEQYIEREDNI